MNIAEKGKRNTVEYIDINKNIKNCVTEKKINQNRKNNQAEQEY